MSKAKINGSVAVSTYTYDDKVGLSIEDVCGDEILLDADDLPIFVAFLLNEFPDLFKDDDE